MLKPRWWKVSVEKSSNVLACGYRADGAGKDVVEQQRGNRQLGQGSAHGLLDHAIDAPADEHGAGLDVDGPHRVAEKHDREHEPGSAFADDLFRIAAHVVRRRSQIGEDNGRGPPEGNKRQHHRSGDEDFDCGPLQILGLCGHSGSRGPRAALRSREAVNRSHQCTAFSAYWSVLGQFGRACSIRCFAEAFGSGGLASGKNSLISERTLRDRTACSAADSSVARIVNDRSEPSRRQRKSRTGYRPSRIRPATLDRQVSSADAIVPGERIHIYQCPKQTHGERSCGEIESQDALATLTPARRFSFKGAEANFGDTHARSGSAINQQQVLIDGPQQRRQRGSRQQHWLGEGQLRQHFVADRLQRWRLLALPRSNRPRPHTRGCALPAG